MFSALQPWCQWLQDTGFSSAIRYSAYVYPLLEGTHVLGLPFR